MTYKIDFNRELAENYILDIYHYFRFGERAFNNGNLLRNIINITKLKDTLKSHRIFGVKIYYSIYNDNDFMRIDYIRINDFYVVENGEINEENLKDSLWKIAYTENKELK